MSSSRIRYERPTRTAGSCPAWTSRYTVMFDTRNSFATSATVTNRDSVALTTVSTLLLTTERTLLGAKRKPGPVGHQWFWFVAGLVRDSTGRSVSGSTGRSARNPQAGQDAPSCRDRSVAAAT